MTEVRTFVHFSASTYADKNRAKLTRWLAVEAQWKKKKRDIVEKCQNYAGINGDSFE